MHIDNSVNYAFSKVFAQKYSIQYAMVLNRLIWSINYHAENSDQCRDRYFIDDHWWMVDSCEALARHFCGLISVATVRRAIKRFEEDGLLISRKRRDMVWDQTKWYAIDMAMFEEIKNSPMITHEVTESESIVQSMHLITESNSTFDHGEQLGLITGSNSSSLNSQSNSHKKSPAAATAAFLSSSLSLEINPKPKKYDDEDLEIASNWLDFALGEMKWKKPHSSWTKATFARDLAKIRRATGITHDGLRELLAFVRKDGFWMDKALSPIGLLKKNANGVAKIDTILLQATKTERKNDKIMAMINSKEDPF